MAPATPPASFYHPAAADLPGPPGSLIASVELVAPPGTRGWAVLYRSRGRDEAPIAVSGLVLQPDTGGPTRSLAWAHGTTGLADACAPSLVGFDQAATSVLVSLAALGFTVTATDYEGLGTAGLHPYLVGISEGRSVLDSIRAARTLTGRPDEERTAILGISQGGHAALWAGELGAAYAPDVRLSGIVAASPPIDLGAVRAALVPGAATPYGRFEALLVAAAWRDHYGLALDGLITAEGRAIARALETACPGDIPAPTADPFLVDPATWPGWQPFISANSPGHGPSAAPVLVIAAADDEVIPPSTIEPGIARLRRAGTDVELRWVPGDHSASLESDAGAALALEWTLARLR